MKKLILAVAIAVGMAVNGFCAFQIPNLEAGVGYDFEVQKVVTCMSSKVLTIETSIGDIDGRIGYTESNKPTASFSFDLKNLEKVNVKIHYVLEDQITLACGISINMDTRKANLFIHAIFGSIGGK